MKNKYSIIALLLMAMLPGTVFAQTAERDPFMPFAWDKPVAVDVQDASKEDIDNTPLTDNPITSYALIGVVVSPKDSIAVIKALDKAEYFAGVGDKIGSEGGVIDVITSEGITIDLNGRLIDLTVNNRFNGQNGSN